MNFDNKTVHSTLASRGSRPRSSSAGKSAISSSPIELDPVSGWFWGQLTGTHSDVPGCFTPCNDGNISGFMGDDEGNCLVALNKILRVHNSSDYLLDLRYRDHAPIILYTNAQTKTR